jgi:molybdopterin/thiamine biosynthesis adenylyltransferase
VTNWNRVERLLGEDAMQHLSQQTVGVIGLGSGGGYVALALAMSGVKNFILIDDDVLEDANIVRHVADNRYVGQPKVEAVTDLIKQRNPDAVIRTVHGRIEDHIELLDEMDVLAVGVDGEGSKFLINEAALEHDLIAVYAGVYERGEGGDVVTIRPYRGPCYACWAETLREGYAMPDPNDVDLDYGQRRPDGTIAAEPGLWLDVVRIANTQTTIVLNVLLEGTSVERPLPANTVILASRPLEIIEGQITPPFGVEWVDISRNANCLVCGEPKMNTSALSLNQLLGNDEIASTDTDEAQVVTGSEDE